MHAQVTIAQLSDTHIGEQHSPHALDNLQRAVEMINARHPDAVVLSGDIGENIEDWERARGVLKHLKAPLYFVPGNHDVHSHDLKRYTDHFGKDYYKFQVKDVDFLVIDSQLLGNFDQFDSPTPPPLSEQNKGEGEKMLSWLAGMAHDDRSRDRGHGRTVIAIQHVPAFRDGNFPPDNKPYWELHDPYRGREMELLHKLGVRHVLAGHWHNARVFEQGGITWHVAPATSWLPWGGELGLAMHTIKPNGDVKTEFVPLGSQP